MNLSREQFETIRRAIARLAERLGRERVALMEVCGTHTMAIFRAGLRAVMPDKVVLLSGPGCPVCVTPGGYVDAAIEIAQRPGVILTTFGDMVKVPGSEGTLELAKARGAQVRVVYSPLDALKLAAEQPDSEVVFLGIGFETTTPLVATAVLDAQRQGLENFSVLSAHKLVPPALRALCAAGDLAIDALILPGHVTAIIGAEPYGFVANEFGVPGVIAGFEAADMLVAVHMLLAQLVEGRAAIEIQYRRCVQPEGNPAAVAQMERAFEPEDAVWRGLGLLPASGLAIRQELAGYDAAKRFGVAIAEVPEPPGCRCADVISGRALPIDCALFGKVCTPGHAVGPCMVSSEGSCAAHYKYGGASQ